MLKFKKFTILTAALCCMFTTLSAQFSAGLGFAYGSNSGGFENEGDFGLQFRAMYGFNENWRASADFITFFDGVDDFSVNEINLNGHYLFVNNEKYGVYGLAGLNLFSVRLKFGSLSTGSTEAGLNLGAGGQLRIAENINGLAEIKYNVGSEADQLVLSAGAVYSFGSR